MSTFNRIGGRYGMHSGSAKFKNLEVVENIYIQGNSIIGTPRNIWYVDSSKTNNGSGTSWNSPFNTLASAVSSAGNYDVILVAENSIETIASGGITITQTGLRIFGSNGSQYRQSAALKIIAGTSPMFTITADRVEIAGFNLSCRIAYPCICIGSVALGVGTAVYSTWIHHNNIDGAGTGTFGVAMGGAGGFGVATQCDAVNCVIENNMFGQLVTAGVVVSGSRMSVINNEFNCIANSTGVTVPETGENRGNWRINDNIFTGIADSTTKAIYFAGNTTLGDGTVARNLLMGSWDVTITAQTGAVGCMNYEASTTGGALIDCNTNT